MLIRSKMPAIQEVKNLTVPPPDIWHLPNGIPVYETNMGTQDIVKLELVFFAGRPYEKKKLAFRGTAALLKEGTRNLSSADIAEAFDYYGGTLALPVSLDTATVQFYSLSKHFEKLLPVLAEILAEPTFPEEELKPFIERNIQRLQVDLTKNDLVAYRKFTELLYGSEHPYGYNSYAETYAALTRDDLVDHFRENYVSGNCQLFLSGRITPDIRSLMEQHLGGAILKGEKKEVAVASGLNRPERVRLPHPGKVQTAVRIGSHLFTRAHEDYNGMYVLNTILGGYFGSRLMANIREDKGYTYNIYSNHDSMLFGGYFYVATEVGNEFVEATIREIYTEMQKLQDKLVKKEEMEMVRNYLLGTLLTNLDGPFNISEVVKAFVTEGLPLSAFEELVETIKTISPKELRDLARKYFKKEDMWEVVV